MPAGNPISLLPLAFLGFGLLFVIIGIFTVVTERRRRATWRCYPGRVVATRLQDGQFQSRVAYLQGGRQHTFWNRFTSSTPIDPVGRAVDVLVDPDDPSDAVVSRGLVSGAVVGYALLAVGLVIAAVGVVTGAADAVLPG